MTEPQAPGRRVLHPLLFAAFPVLYLFAENLADAELGDVLGSLVVSLAGAGLLLLLAKLLYKDLRRAGIAVSVFLLLFFSYGYVATAMEGVRLGGLSVGRHRYLVPIWGLLVVLGAVWAGRARRLDQTTRAMNVVALILVAINVVTIGADRITSALGGGGRLLQARIPQDPVLAEGAERPDIFHVIFDRYGGQRALEEIYGYDNGPFLEELERRGFYVASESRGNYPKTLLSVASSLNADHLTYLTRDLEPGTRDRGPLRQLVKHHAVGRYLQALGYRYTHLGSWWGTTARSPEADVNVSKGGLGEFATALFETTMARPFVLASGLDFERREYERVRFQFDQLERLARERGGAPRFVFAHILSPHGPYVFDRRGRFVDEATRERRTERENYIQQLEYVNGRILRLLDLLQAGPAASHPVVLLQSDEGPGEAPSTREGFRPRALDKKFPILNTFYLPGIEDPGLYPDITPVNSFRKVFDLYFDADLPMLPDRTYVYQSLDRVYDFVDVTDLVRAERVTPPPS